MGCERELSKPYDLHAFGVHIHRARHARVFPFNDYLDLRVDRKVKRIPKESAALRGSRGTRGS